MRTILERLDNQHLKFLAHYKNKYQLKFMNSWIHLKTHSLRFSPILVNITQMKMI